MTVLSLELLPLWTAQQARAADRTTIDDVGIPGIVLMEHAGRAVAEVVLAEHARRADGAVVVDVVCGAGNNGGDGWVCARHLAGRGAHVRVLTSVAPSSLRGDAALAARLLLSAQSASFGERVVIVQGDGAALAAALEGGDATIIVDALQGTGLSRPLDDGAAAVVAAVARRRSVGACVIAVDLPSGLPTDGQAPDGAVVDADVTVTFSGRKIAHVAEPGFVFCGTVVDVDIGVLPAAAASATAFLLRDVRLPVPSLLAHKGTFGHVGVVVGAPGTAGAAVLAGQGALRAGAGRVSLLGQERADVLRPAELMARPLDDEGMRDLDVIVVGPGLVPVASPGEESGGASGLVRSLAHARARGARIVADAGALGVVPAALVDVATPHPGEAARLLGCTTAAVQRDRRAAAHALVERCGSVVVLKGAAPVVATASRAVVVAGAVPSLAVAGSGDVLAGVLGAVLGGAWGDALPEVAAVAAVELHQRAGRRLARGARAGEIADAVAVVVAEAGAR